MLAPHTVSETYIDDVSFGLGTPSNQNCLEISLKSRELSRPKLIEIEFGLSRANVVTVYVEIRLAADLVFLPGDLKNLSMPKG